VVGPIWRWICEGATARQVSVVVAMGRQPDEQGRATTMKRPLAFDQNGDQFDVPSTAYVWRVSKQKQPRRPFEPLYTPEGKLLDIPIDTDHDELPGHLDESGDDCRGRYKFVALDSQGQTACEPFGFAILSGVGDDDPQPRNAAPAYGGEIASALEALASTIRELKQRDEETLSTLRKTIEHQTLTLTSIAQTLAGVRPRSLPEEEYEEVAAPEPETPPPPPQLSAMEQVQKFMTALPDLLKGIDLLRSMLSAAATTPATPSAPPRNADGNHNGTSGTHGANGVGAHAPTGNGTKG
jgi:hypothetical protein